MKKSILGVVCAIFLAASCVAAQEETRGLPAIDANRYSSSRLDNLVNQFKNISVDLVDRTSEDLRGRNASRGEIEAAFLAQQLDASAGFFQSFIRDNRRAAELRDAAAILSDLVRRAPNSGTNGNLWRDAQQVAADINRELGGTGGGGNNGGGGGNNPPPSSGRAFWRGTVDKEVHLVVQRRSLETRTISGTPYTNETSSFTASMPTRNVTVEAIKKTGRGQVRVIEQPNRDNDYTAVIQILDEGGGAREYQLEIVWR